MQVVEKFISINGEGPRAGEPAVFIRFKGCNLSCSYCDTEWANRKDCPYEEMTPEEILAYVKDTKITNVTLTGGEPLLQKEMPALLEKLGEDPLLHVEIETNGAVDLLPFCKTHRPAFTMDYKLPSSGYEEKMVLQNFVVLKKEDAVKFVAGSKADLEAALHVIREQKLIGKCSVFFSPVFGQIEPVEIVDFLLKHQLNGVRMQIQMHKVIWDPDKRGV